MNSTNFGIGIRGEFLECPLEAQVWVENQTLCWKGNSHFQGKALTEILRFVDPNLMDSAEADSALLCLVEEVIGDVSASLVVTSRLDFRSFELDTDFLTARALIRRGSSAFIFKLTDSSNSPSEKKLNWICDSLQKVKNNLCLADLFLAYRRGFNLDMADLTGRAESSKLPSPLMDAQWLAYGRFKFDKTTMAGKAVESLVGIKELDLFLGMNPQQSEYAISLSFPKIQNKYLVSDELYLLVGLKDSHPSFEFKGSFEFPGLGNGLTFIASGSFTYNSFLLAAELKASTNQELPNFGGFRFGNAALMIGYAQGGLTFGLFATIYVRDLMVFGATIIKVVGEVPVPVVVSGAIDPVSLPVLCKNFTGKELPGLDALDIISLDRFHKFEISSPFDLKALEKCDKRAVAAFFNKNIKNDALALDASNIEIRKLANDSKKGFGLVDQKRMRHYFINAQGEIFLQAQFYVSSLPEAITFGEYTISPGIFLSGAIQLFGKRFSALFSLSKEGGILAYAELDPLEFKIDKLTVFKITASTKHLQTSIKLSPQDLVAQLVPAKPQGLVFFLSASKKDVTFYFDGHLEFLGLFCFDARLIYFARNVSVHAEFVYLGIQVIFILDASYSNMLTAGFVFLLRLDTKALTEKLDAVTKRIDQALTTLQHKITEAKSSLAIAQSQVDQLLGEINQFKIKIENCKTAIKKASWWMKPFVSVAKGAEIAAYEVAIAGIWTAYGVATASLELAKLTVSAFGNLSAGLLNLVNATIRTATSLLFLRSAEISVDVLPASGQFCAKLQIAFVALGKEYKICESVGMDNLKNNLLGTVSQQMLNPLEPDLKNVEQGKEPQKPKLKSFRSLLTEGEPIPDIKAASSELKKASFILARAQTLYRERLGEDLADFAALNASFSTALHTVDNSLATANLQAIPPGLKDLPSAVRQLDQSQLSEADRNSIQSALEDVDRAHGLHEQMQETSVATAEAHQRILDLTKDESKFTVSAQTLMDDQQMIELLHELQDEIHQTYPEDEDTSYINLSLEPLHEYFQEARNNLGEQELAVARPTRLRKISVKPSTYRQRL